MTCEQFRRCVDLGPDECTRAERAAGRKHAAQCRNCRRWLLLAERAQRASLTPADVKRAGLHTGILLAQDRGDPEFDDV
jgi:hypothetical protein